MKRFRQTQDSRLRFALPSVQTSFLHNDAIIYSFNTWVSKTIYCLMAYSLLNRSSTLVR